MNALAAPETGYSNIDPQDYEMVTVTDKGLVFKNPDNELIWMEVDGAYDVLIDDALPPQEEVTVERPKRRYQPRRGRLHGFQPGAARRRAPATGDAHAASLMAGAY